jgi:isocitrate/isopropylmalate dehydrogenase
MMLDHLGHGEPARVIEEAVETAIADKKIRTPDLGGKATTEEMGRAIAEIVSVR